MIRLHFTRWLRFVVFAAGLMILLAGCARQSIYDAHKDHDHEHAWDYVGDVNATPADAVEGADFMEAPFVLMETASVDYNSTTGTAQMAVHDHGTTVTLRLSNLLPNTDYISHVHEEPCSTGGGAHYRFDPDAGELPPNEIHIDFTSDDDGTGFMTAENANPVDESAHSVIVQTTAEVSLLCADMQ
ncbi:MAG: hypothetical protein F4Y37_10750 [Caldilineaceae bacterium SB0664_bin_22]|nr:hypothetical protein [Caldilineaceae bacterium SB0664_bin_22]